MTPLTVQFESEGESKHVTNQAWALCNNFNSVDIADIIFKPRLLAVVPDNKKTKLVVISDPPPWAA